MKRRRIDDDCGGAQDDDEVVIVAVFVVPVDKNNNNKNCDADYHRTRSARLAALVVDDYRPFSSNDHTDTTTVIGSPISGESPRISCTRCVTNLR